MEYEIVLTKKMAEQIFNPNHLHSKPLKKGFKSYSEAFMYGIGRFGSGTHLSYLEDLSPKERIKTNNIGWYVQRKIR